MSKKKNLEQEVLISETEETTDAVVVTDESEVKPAKEEKVSKTASKKTSRKMTNLKTRKTKSLKKKASLNAKLEKQ